MLAASFVVEVNLNRRGNRAGLFGTYKAASFELARASLYNGSQDSPIGAEISRALHIRVI